MSNDRDLKEKLEVLSSTLSKLVRVVDPKPGGRFAAEAITRAEQAASQGLQYPQIPSGPWGSDWPNPTEAPLGFDINRVEPVEAPVAPSPATETGALPESPRVERAQLSKGLRRI